MKKLLFFLFVLSCACYISAGSLPDSIIVKGTVVDTLQTFRTGYFTTFGRMYYGSFFEDTEGILHVSLVDNYELFHGSSEDNGITWSFEKIITGHEGDILLAQIVVDNLGKVFISFTAHDDFNYANPSGVQYAGEFHYNLYCVNNKTGSWVSELVGTYDAGNSGPRAALLFTDAFNNVHLLANKYGWGSYGGTIWEWIRYGTTDSWGGRRTIKEFTDANIDQSVYDNYLGIVSLVNKYALVCTRTKYSNLELFYVLGEDSTWEEPVTLETNLNGLSSFSIAYTPTDHLYIAWLYNQSANYPGLKISKDFGTPQPINLNLAPGDTLVTLRMFCDKDELLTIVMWMKNKNQSLLFSNDGFTWSDPQVIDSSSIYYLGGFTPRTNTVMGSFSDKLKMMGVKAGPRTTQPYGPDTLYFGEAYILRMPSSPELLSPADSVEIDSTSMEFTWGESFPQISNYWFEIADNPEFNSSFIDSTLQQTIYKYDSLELNKTYYWRVRAMNGRGWGQFSETFTITTIFVSVKDLDVNPDNYFLSQNYPNPFNPSTIIEYGLKENTTVRLTVINILGEEVKVLIDMEQSQGVYQIAFNGKNFPSGIYFYKLKAGGREFIRKMIFLK